MGFFRTYPFLRYLMLHRSVCKYALSLRKRSRKRRMSSCLLSSIPKLVEKRNKQMKHKLLPFSPTLQYVEKKFNIASFLLVLPLLATDNWMI